MTEKKTLRHKIQLVEVLSNEIFAKSFNREPKSEKVSIHIGVSEKGEAVDSEKAWAELNVTIKGTPEDKQLSEEDTLFEIRVALHGKLLASKSVNKDELEHFARTQGRFLLWPYAREMVESLSQRMGIYPSLVLPTLDITRGMRKETEKPKKKSKPKSKKKN